MADADCSLPVRTRSDEELQILTKAGSSVVVAQSTASNLNATITATALDIRAIDEAKDDILVYGWDGTANQKIATYTDGEIKVNKITNIVKVSKDVNANATDNPIYVYSVTTAGTKVVDYDTVSAVGAGSPSNHDYVITNTKTMSLNKVLASASGAMKVVILTGLPAGLATIGVAFTSMAFPTADIEFIPTIEQASTGTEIVRVTRTNRENKAMDVYSTIMGTEV